MEADRILCLSEGRVVEFDAPINLLNNPEGFFYQLVNNSGPEAAKRLKEMALQHAPPNTAKSISSPQLDGPKSYSSNTTTESKENVTSITSSITPPTTSTQRPHVPLSLGGVFIQPPSSPPASQK